MNVTRRGQYLMYIHYPDAAMTMTKIFSPPEICALNQSCVTVGSSEALSMPRMIF